MSLSRGSWDSHSLAPSLPPSPTAQAEAAVPVLRRGARRFVRLSHLLARPAENRSGQILSAERSTSLEAAQGQEEEGSAKVVCARPRLEHRPAGLGRAFAFSRGIPAS